jgi:hypothetical protein
LATSYKPVQFKLKIQVLVFGRILWSYLLLEVNFVGVSPKQYMTAKDLENFTAIIASPLADQAHACKIMGSISFSAKTTQDKAKSDTIALVKYWKIKRQRHTCCISTHKQSVSGTQ